MLPPIAHEPTNQTGLSHKNGAISLAREAPGSASAATAPSPALRRALRDLSWRMAALLLPRSPGC